MAKNEDKSEDKKKAKLMIRLRAIVYGVVAVFRWILRKCRQRFTFMFIPHSEKPIFNFHISIFSLLFLLFLEITLVVSFFLLSANFTSSKRLENNILHLLGQDKEVYTKQEIESVVKSNIWFEKWERSINLLTEKNETARIWLYRIQGFTIGFIFSFFAGLLSNITYAGMRRKKRTDSENSPEK